MVCSRGNLYPEALHSYYANVLDKDKDSRIGGDLCLFLHFISLLIFGS